ncbi:T9SS type A sorting domain-containing protein [Flavobacterium sp.]|uniref:T9SS type A sorting domain-containing protein n=1 Tax=Flavobacterium sp. TaxID=239 RepID=UPI003529CEA8
MKKATLIISLLFCTLAFGQTYTGPIAKPLSGYGADGAYSLTNVSVTNPVYTQNVQIYYPTGITSSVPTIFFAHGFSLSSPVSYLGFINFLVSKGYAVVFVPYPISGTNQYTVLEQGFLAAATNYPSILDTSKVGFIGHSFGAGAIFAIANNLITTNNWGNSGKFLVPISQWYSYNISQSQLENFDNSTKLLSIITEDENVTDHRMAIDIFQNINIANTEKDIVYIHTDVISGYNYTADHYTSLTNSSFDALDYYAIYRLVDALADYTFTGNATAKDIALGNGSTVQTQLSGGLSSLVVNDFLAPQFPESNYSSPCTNALNPRASYCAALNQNSATTISTVFYPNPFKETIRLQTPLTEIRSIEVFDANFKTVAVLTNVVIENNETTLNLSKLPSGLYFIKITTKTTTALEKVIKLQ